jgi:hypothetical protein
MFLISGVTAIVGVTDVTVIYYHNMIFAVDIRLCTLFTVVLAVDNC